MRRGGLGMLIVRVLVHVLAAFIGERRFDSLGIEGRVAPTARNPGADTDR